MSLKIKYTLGDHGWASLEMKDKHQHASMTVSYLHDTLAELITAANLLLKGAPDAKVIAMDEPGEHIIHLKALDPMNIAIEIRWFEDWASWNLATEKDFEVVFVCQETTAIFSREVFSNAQRILNDNGMEGYKKKWIEHDFPIDEYNRLKSLLRC